MYKLGIDLGGTGIKAALLDKNGSISQRAAIATHCELGYQAVFDRIAQCAGQCLEQEHIKPSDLKAIGLAAAGMLSEDGQEIVFSSNLRFLHVKAVDEMKKRFPCPIALTNDADAAALGEHFYGAGKGAKSSVTITLGTGIGSGIVMNNRIMSGSFRSGAEIGHQIIEANGIQCRCGQQGCLEVYASGTALIVDAARRARENPSSLLNSICSGNLSKLDAGMVFQAHYNHDPDATRAVEQFTKYLGIGIINVINLLQPEAVIIGGGLSAEKENLTKPLNDYVRKHLLFGGQNMRTKIRYALLGNDAGALGAAMLCE
jgi:glucokinase